MAKYSIIVQEKLLLFLLPSFRMIFVVRLLKGGISVDLLREINDMRRSLHDLLSKRENICEQEIILHSQKLDKLIAQYYLQIKRDTNFQQSTH